MVELLTKAYQNYLEYVNLALTFDDTEIDSFAEWAWRHYGIAHLICTTWEYESV